MKVTQRSIGALARPAASRLGYALSVFSLVTSDEGRPPRRAIGGSVRRATITSGF